MQRKDSCCSESTSSCKANLAIEEFSSTDFKFSCHHNWKLAYRGILKHSRVSFQRWVNWRNSMNSSTNMHKVLLRLKRNSRESIWRNRVLSVHYSSKLHEFYNELQAILKWEAKSLEWHKTKICEWTSKTQGSKIESWGVHKFS